MRTIVPSIFVTCILIVFPSFDAVAAFSDVPRSHPYVDAIEYLQREQIVQGYPDGTFAPNRTINRAEFVKIVVERFVSQEERTRCTTDLPPFPDAPLSSWFGSYVSSARCAGLIEGYPDGTFRPAHAISFVEAAKIIAIEHANDVGIKSPADHGPGIPWYAGPVARLEAYHAIPLSITQLSEFITRGEMAEMVYRLYDNHDDLPSQALEVFRDGNLLMARETHFFRRDTLRVGDTLQFMVVSSISPDAIVFTGTATLNARYREQSATNPTCPVLLEAIETGMSDYIPRERGNERITDICLDNDIAELRRQFQTGTTGRTSMTISRWTYSLTATSYHSAHMDSAYVEPDGDLFE